MRKKTMLVTGANGQIGTVLTAALRKKYGDHQIVATDLRKTAHQAGPFEMLNVLDRERFRELIDQYKVTEVYHLAAILSAKGEQNPQRTWQINMDGLFNVLELAREFDLKVFFPSSIAVFGSASPKFDTPQLLSAAPETVYGISKMAGEYWAQYYHSKYGVDVRSIRYPGIISHQSLPGGGTTDYAVEIFHEAIQHNSYTCFLKPDSQLPMMYISDAIRATIEIMEAPTDQIKVRTSYNLAGFSVTPQELATEIQKQLPSLQIEYKPDYRQNIADSWTATIDDSAARADWGWKPEFDLAAMTKEMIENLSKKYELIKA